MAGLKKGLSGAWTGAGSGRTLQETGSMDIATAWKERMLQVIRYRSTLSLFRKDPQET